MDVKWKKGVHAKTAPEVAYEELTRIRDENGGDLAPAVIVKESKPKTAPLNPEFEWNDKVAAHKFREGRARELCRGLVEVRADSPDLGPVRVFELATISEDGKPAHVYRTLDDVLSDPEQRQKLLKRALSELASFRKRYSALSELSHIIAVVDEALEKAS